MITLKNANLEIQINPKLGAGLHAFRYHGTDILRPAKEQVQTPQQQSMFLMIPYCSYIKDGHFNYFGINRFVPANQPNMTEPIHGDVWQKQWEIEKQSDDTVTLKYTHDKTKGFPFSYQAKVLYSLTDTGLNVTLSVTNISELPMPCGMGLHPYFLYSKEAEIAFVSSHIWHHKTDPIFDRPYPTPDQWNFTKGKKISEDFDTAFGGWDGHAQITYPEHHFKIVITAEDIFHHLILYHPQNTDFFCLEPVSNTPNAFNLAAYGVIGTGIQSIGGGQTLSKTITISCHEI